MNTKWAIYYLFVWIIILIMALWIHNRYLYFIIITIGIYACYRETSYKELVINELSKLNDA